MYILEQLFFAQAFSLGLARRPHSARHYLAYGAVFLLLLILQIWAVPGDAAENIENPLLMALSSTFFCGLIFVLVILFLRGVRDISLSEAVYAATCAYAGEHVAYCLRLLAGTVTRQPLADSHVYPLYWLITLSVAVACRLLFARHMIYHEHYNAPPVDTLRLTAGVILVIMELSIVASILQFRVTHAVYALIFCIFVLYSQMERQRAMARQSEADIREQLLISQRAQYDRYKENVDLVNRKCHDLKHQVAALRLMGEKEERNQVLQEIEDSVLFYDSFLKTGNEGLDTILTQKNLVCTENGILFTCMADGALLSFLDPVDLFTLFGNLMDNAIEAVFPLPEEERSIRLTVNERLGIILIREENPVAQELKVEEGKIKTTKKDAENHGFGLRSMELVAEKYDGALSAASEGGLFRLTISLSPPETDIPEPFPE